MLKPYIVSIISDVSNNDSILEYFPVIKKGMSDLVKYVLESVVTNGSERNAY